MNTNEADMTDQNERPWFAPTGSRITGTAESVLCTCGIFGIEADGEPIYDGNGADVHWDTQEQRKRDGKLLFTDENGDEWTFDQLTQHNPSHEKLRAELNELENAYTGKPFADGLITKRIEEIRAILNEEIE